MYTLECKFWCFSLTIIIKYTKIKLEDDNMLVNSNRLFDTALKEGYAVPAYNVNSLEWARFILEACNEDKSPTILAITPSSVSYFGGYKIVVSVIKMMIEELGIKIPVVLHLDHAKDFMSCKKAIDAGFTSVMIDASKMSFEDNVELTRQVVNYAKKHDVSVEAELGSLSSDGNYSSYVYSDLEQSYDFVSRTGVDSFAPAIGNVHGFYKGDEKIDFELLGAICKMVKIPLVLHGASGLDDNKLKTAIFCGVTKVNINTDLMYAWSCKVRRFLEENKNAYDPRKIILSGEKEIKKVIHAKNMIIGSKNRI